jgi:hypothetical protein
MGIPLRLTASTSSLGAASTPSYCPVAGLRLNNVELPKTAPWLTRIVCCVPSNIGLATSCIGKREYLPPWPSSPLLVYYFSCGATTAVPAPVLIATSAAQPFRRRRELSWGGCVRRGGSWASGASPIRPQGCPRVISIFPQGFAATRRFHVVLTAADVQRGFSSSLPFDASTVAIVRRGHSCVTLRCGRTGLCCPHQRPGALHAGALHAGGALASRARMLSSDVSYAPKIVRRRFCTVLANCSYLYTYYI